jgi:hypothetical protein
MIGAAALPRTEAQSDLAAYFPLVPGTQWVYRSGSGEQVVRRVGALTKAAGQECRMIETVADGAVAQAECFRVTAAGVYVMLRSSPAGSAALTPPQPLLSAPVAVGRRWQWTGVIGDRTLTFDYQWARRETVVTPGGTFDTMQLYVAGEPVVGAQLQSWRWFARGVGLVKEDTVISRGSQQQRGYLELMRLVRGR